MPGISTNRRIYFAIHAAGIASPDGSTNYVPIHGLQTLGLNTKYNLEQVFEIGQLALYENIENVPDIEITLEKVLDGNPLIYHLCTQGVSNSSLAGRSTAKALFALTVYPDTFQASSGQPLVQCQVSGVFTQQLAYTFSVDGPSRESVTLVANNKTWQTGTPFTFQPTFGNDLPFGSGFVARRQHIIFGAQSTASGTSSWQQQYTQLPTDIPGISTSGTNDSTGGLLGAHLQSIKTSANLGRDALLELGKRGPYFRYVNFPVEVRTDYELIALIGDLMGATEAGVLAGASGANVGYQTLTIKSLEGTYCNLGKLNKLTSVNYTGANAGARGGNATLTFSYLTFNDFTILHPQDPAGFST